MERSTPYPGTGKARSTFKVHVKEQRERAFTEISGRMNVLSKSVPSFSRMKSMEDEGMAAKLKDDARKQLRRHSVASKYASPKIEKQKPSLGSKPSEVERKTSSHRPLQNGYNDVSKKVSSSTGRTGGKSAIFWGTTSVNTSNRKMIPSNGHSHGESKRTGSLHATKSTVDLQSLDTSVVQGPESRAPGGPGKQENVANQTLLKSASYWLEQIKLAETIRKHTVSLGFFHLAIECEAEPLQMLRDELISYKRRYNLCSDSVSRVLLCYGIVEEGQNASGSEQVPGNTPDLNGTQIHCHLVPSNERKVASHVVSMASARTPASPTFGTVAGGLLEINLHQQLQNTGTSLMKDSSKQESELTNRGVQKISEVDASLDSTCSCNGGSNFSAYANASSQLLQTSGEDLLCDLSLAQTQTQQFGSSILLSTFQPQSPKHCLPPSPEIKGRKKTNSSAPTFHCTPKREFPNRAAVLKLQQKEIKVSAQKVLKERLKKEIEPSEAVPAHFSLSLDGLKNKKENPDTLNLEQPHIEELSEKANEVTCEGENTANTQNDFASESGQPSRCDSNSAAKNAMPVEAMDVDSLVKEVVSGIMLSMDDPNNPSSEKIRLSFGSYKEGNAACTDGMDKGIIQPYFRPPKNSYVSCGDADMSIHSQNTSDTMTEDNEDIITNEKIVSKSTEHIDAISPFETVESEQQAACNGCEPSLDIWNELSEQEKAGLFEYPGVCEEEEVQSLQAHILVCNDNESQFHNEKFSNGMVSTFDVCAAANIDALMLHTDIMANEKNGQEKNVNSEKSSSTSESGLCEVAMDLIQVGTSAECSSSNNELNSTKDWLYSEETVGADLLNNPPEQLVQTPQMIYGFERVCWETPKAARLSSQNLRTPSSIWKARTSSHQGKMGTHDRTPKDNLEGPMLGASRKTRSSQVKTAIDEHVKVGFSHMPTGISLFSQHTPRSGTGGSARRGRCGEKQYKQEEEWSSAADVYTISGSPSTRTPGSNGLRRSERLRGFNLVSTPHKQI